MATLVEPAAMVRDAVLARARTAPHHEGCSALHRGTAVDRNRRAGHEVRGGAREKHRDAGKILRIAPAASRRAREHALVQSLNLAPRALRELRVDPARQYRIDLDVVLGPRGRAGAREL